MVLSKNNDDLSSGNAESRPVENSSLLKDKLFISVFLISAILSLICLTMNIMNPPLDGDSYEYAGVAADFVEHGQLRMNHVGVGYHVFGQKIHQPAWNRATLWTFIIVPFQALFGASFLSFLVPYVISLFLLAPAIYIFARKYFGQNIAFCASLATLLNPRIIHWSISEDPGQPEALIIILSLCVIGFLVDRKFIASGAALGLLLLTRMIGLLFLPPIFIWSILFRRRELTTKNILIFILSFIIASSPLLVRNKIVFGKFLYNDQATSVFRTGEQLVDLSTNPNVFDKLVFKYRFPEEFKKPRIEFTPAQFLVFVRENARTYIFGYHNGVAWYPGLIGLLSPLMIPFVLIGLLLCAREPEKSLTVIFSVFFILAMITFRWTYEDRYIFSSLPFFIILAFYAAQEISKKIKFITPTSLLLAFIVVEAFPPIFGATTMAPDNSRQPRYHELSAICEWVKTETPENAVMMTIPFWSPQYLCARPTALPATGGLDIFKHIADQYSVNYFMFTDYWGGDRFPKLPFMEPVIRGKYISLYQVDRKNPYYTSIADNKYYMDSFDFLTYFWKNPLNVNLDLQPSVTLSQKYGNLIAAIIYFCACLFIFWVSTIRSFTVKLIICSITAISLFGLTVSVLAGIGKNFNLIPPPVCKAQAKMFFQRLTEEGGRSRIAILSSDKSKILGDALSSSTGIKTEKIENFSGEPPDSETVYFIPVEEKGEFITSIEGAANSFEQMKKEKESYSTAEKLLRDRGMDTEIISGGVLGF